MTDSASVTRGDVARGAGLAGLARLGALIEAVAQPVFTWLFGLATYGLYVVLWGAINLLSNLIDIAMPAALQRLVPGADTEERVHAILKLALLATFLPAAILSALVTWQAEFIATLLSAAPEDRATLPRAIALFAWALPLWTFIEIATAAARARRAFGPEIRLRIFWEQIARIGFAVGFFALGAGNLGLVAAHLCSLVLTSLLCVPLLGRYYDLRLLVRAPLAQALPAETLATGLGLLPTNLVRRLLVDAPPVVLNLLLPGARGAIAAGLFEIARKISTVPLIVRQAFQYVMAPLASAQARHNRAEIGPLYHFAARVSTALVVPLAGLLVFAGADILSLYRPEAAAALPLLYVLVAARATEALVGPATPVVEMVGHRLLPLLNSLLAVTVWALLAFWLVPSWGALGMAIGVAAGTLAGSFAASVELKLSDNLSPFDARLLIGLGIGLAGMAAMAMVEAAIGGPIRFASVFALWTVTSWLALRLGLTAGDRQALGGLARTLRLL